MSTEPIESLQSVEQVADKTLNSARQLAKQTIDAAQKDAAIFVAEAVEKSKKDAQSHIFAAQQESRQCLDAAMADVDVEMQRLRNNVRAKQPEAVKAVMDALA